MDYPQLRKKDLKQKIRPVWNFIERWKIEHAMPWLIYEGSTHLLDKIDDIEFCGSLRGNIDCRQYAIGDRSLKELIPGVLEHNGNPEPGDIIIYGYGIHCPKHVGIWQRDGRVLSKWGDYSPIMLHRWNQVVFDYGFSAFFSDSRYLRDKSLIL